jgi:signal transduction histidine kinase
MGHPLAVDAVVAGFFAVASAVHVAGESPGWGHPSVWAALALALGATVPFALRRRHPLGVLAVITLSLAVATAAGLAYIPNPLPGVVLYTVAVTRDRRAAVAVLGLVEVALVAAAGAAFLAGYRRNDGTFAVLVAAAAWFVGDSVRARRSYMAGLAGQEADRQREEIERAHRSVAEERLRIARELHDVVAHSLSVIAVQSGVGRHVAATQPEEARKALAAVEATSRAALEELRGVLGSLRRAEDGAPALAPEPGVADLPQLVEQVRAAGVPVELDVRGDPAPLSRGQQLSIYRIVQEALTNVVKHAGPARARVTLEYRRDAVTVGVADDGPGTGRAGAGAPDGAGVAAVAPVPSSGRHGIVGMRERVETFGGKLVAGPGARGGFEVVASMPLHGVPG